MKIKNLVYVSLLLLTTYAYSEELTRYIVRSDYRVPKDGYADFNDVLAAENGAGKTGSLFLDEDEKKALNLKLQVMQAISQKIKDCFIGKITADKMKAGAPDELVFKDIEDQYIRNESIDIDINKDVELFISMLIPCELLTGSSYFDLLRTKWIGISNYYVRNDDNLAQANAYLAEVERLGLAQFDTTLTEAARIDQVKQISKDIKNLKLKKAVTDLVNERLVDFTNMYEDLYKSSPTFKAKLVDLNLRVSEVSSNPSEPVVNALKEEIQQLKQKAIGKEIGKLEALLARLDEVVYGEPATTGYKATPINMANVNADAFIALALGLHTLNAVRI